MRFRSETHPGGPTVAVHHGGRWVPLAAAAGVVGRAPEDLLGAPAGDLVGLLSGGEAVRERISALCEQVSGEDFTAGVVGLPWQPRLLRCFAGWRVHWEQAARTMARRYHPLRPGPIIRAFEAVTRSTFPPLRPGRQFFEHPVYYLGNHLTLLPDGAEAPWPSYGRDLDYELEFGMVVVRPLLDADERKARAAIGGFVVFNDLSCRDAQWEEYSGGLFGPVVKAKGFAGALGAEVVSPDEVLPWIDDLPGRVQVNSEEWTRTSTAGMQFGVGDLLAWASRGEQVVPGELHTSGTLPSGAGMELDRWLQEGDVVTLQLDRIGEVTTPIGHRRPAGG